jgi:hypothetical protein
VSVAEADDITPAGVEPIRAASCQRCPNKLCLTLDVHYSHGSMSLFVAERFLVRILHTT